MVGELLQQSRYRIDQLYALPEWEHPLAESTSLNRVTERELGRISQLRSPNQVLAVVDLPDSSNDLPREFGTSWSLYLDGIQSPANLGAILRVADWFGLATVSLGPETADLYNHKSIQASMGSFLRVDSYEQSLAEITARFPELPIYGADASGASIFTAELPKAGVLVIGQEGQGIRAESRPHLQNWLRIPRSSGRQAESLNAAVAAGIICGQIAQKTMLQ